MSESSVQIGMTAFELYQFLERSGFTGPMVCTLREQFLKTGTCTFESINMNDLNTLLESWGSGPVNEFSDYFPSIIDT